MRRSIVDPSLQQKWQSPKLADIDCDGDLDILNKPYTWEAPRVDVWLNNGKFHKK